MEYKRIELERLQVLWRNSEGPDKKVSRHLGRFATWGRTLEDAVVEGYIFLVRSFLWQIRHPFITATFLRLFSRTMVYGLLLSCLLS
jgi:hypothetical protein